mgnify:CR=1 FL=1
MIRRFWLGPGAGVVLGIIVLLSAGGCGGGSGAASPLAGSPAPDFVLEDLQGEQVALSGLRGTPVLVNFWASWCAPCRLEMPLLQAAAEKHGEGRLAVLGVNYGEEAETARSFLRENALTIRVVLDRDFAVSRLYRVRGIPTSFFIDAEGIIAAVHVGMFNQRQLDANLQKILR